MSGSGESGEPAGMLTVSGSGIKQNSSREGCIWSDFSSAGAEGRMVWVTDSGLVRSERSLGTVHGGK